MSDSRPKRQLRLHLKFRRYNGSRRCSVVVAVLTVKPVSDDSGRFGAEGGIDLFAGKSEITEGCSDLREIGDLPLCGCQRAVRRKAGRRRKSWTPAESRMLRCGVKRMLLMMRHFDAAGAAVIGGSGVWFASVRLLEPTPCKPVLRPGSAIDRHLSR
jgi:hypothetical protein